MEKTLDEYMSQLQLLAEQAKLDGNEKVHDFTIKLLAEQNIDERLIELIFTYFDSLNDADMVVYDYLLQKKAPYEWFEFIGFLSDQRGVLAEYFPILVKAVDEGLDVSILQEAERTSSNLEDFCRLVENQLPEAAANTEIPEQENRYEDAVVLLERVREKNEFIQHLKDENFKLNERLDSVMQENNSYKQEQRDMMKSSISSKRAVLDYKVELEALKRNYEKEQVLLAMTRRKLEKAQELGEKLSKINDKLTAVRQEQNDVKERLEKELYKLKEDAALYISENEILRKQVAALQQITEQQINAWGVTDRREKHGEVPAVAEAFENPQETMELSFDESVFLDGVEDLGYNPDKVEPIRSNKEAVKKRSNFFAALIARHFEKRFEKKSYAEQENLIFVKLMENEFSMDVVRAVKKALSEGQPLSRTELYKMVAGGAPDDSVMRFCGVDI